MALKMLCDHSLEHKLADLAVQHSSDPRIGRYLVGLTTAFIELQRFPYRISLQPMIVNTREGWDHEWYLDIQIPISICPILTITLQVEERAKALLPSPNFK